MRDVNCNPSWLVLCNQCMLFIKSVTVNIMHNKCSPAATRLWVLNAFFIFIVVSNYGKDISDITWHEGLSICPLQYWESNPQPSGHQSDFLTIRPLLWYFLRQCYFKMFFFTNFIYSIQFITFTQLLCLISLLYIFF